MAAWKSELHTIESVLNFYEQHENSMFRIYAGNKPEIAYCRFEYYEDNKEQGNEILYNNLLALKQNVNNTNQYLLQIIGSLKETSKGAKPSQFYNVTFQLNSNDAMQPINSINGSSGNDYLFQKLIESNERNNQLLQTLLQDKETEEQEPEEENFINGILKNEQMQSLLIAGLTKLLTPKSGGLAGSPNPNIVSLNNQQELEILEAIERLKKVDNNLPTNLKKLADIAENEPQTFSYLISMLNKF